VVATTIFINLTREKPKEQIMKQKHRESCSLTAARTFTVAPEKESFRSIWRKVSELPKKSTSVKCHWFGRIFHNRCTVISLKISNRLNIQVTKNIMIRYHDILLIVAMIMVKIIFY
jgi:hypothetical protein